MTAINKNHSFSTLINNLSRRFIQKFNDRLALHGVTYAQWRFLLSLWEHDGLTQKSLSQKASIEPATTVRTLDRMERDGVIKRVRSAKDRREINIYLTEKGKSLNTLLLPIVNELEVEVAKGLQPGQVSVFGDVLHHMLNQLK